MLRRVGTVLFSVLRVVMLLLLIAPGLPARAGAAQLLDHTTRETARLDPHARASPAVNDDLLDQVLAAGKLVVATDANYPPFSWIDEHGQLVGFDVDVARSVAARLGVAVEFKTPPWDQVTAGNWGGEWDVSIGSMTPTDPRSLVLWFTEPYYYVPGSFALHEDNTTITSVEQLSGKRVGVTSGTNCQAYLTGTLDIEEYGGVVAYPPPAGIDVIPYDWDGLAIADLEVGDGVILDAVMSSWFSLQGAIDGGAPLKFLGDPAFYEPTVFALDQARGPSDLMIAALNDIILDLRADGTLRYYSGQYLLGHDVSSPAPPGAVEFSSVYLPLVAR